MTTPALCDLAKGIGGLENHPKPTDTVLDDTKRMAAMLLTDDCAKGLGFSDGGEARAVMSATPIVRSDLGFTSTALFGTRNQSETSYNFNAAYFDGTTIILNNNAALKSLTAVPISSKDGREVTTNIIANFEREYGLRPDSLSQIGYWTIFLLHELGHKANNGIRNDFNDENLSKANTRTVIDNCFKGLKL